MFNYIQYFIYSASNHLNDFDQAQWVMLSAMVVLVGGFCLRGFGERI